MGLIASDINALFAFTTTYMRTMDRENPSNKVSGWEDTREKAG
jgi:hypothetical protein